MRAHDIPQFTVDGHRPVGAFDLLGMSFSTELGYTNMLTALDLAGIPLSAVERTEEHPLVVAGGHAAFNPEPIAEFIDAAVLGDGEQAVLEITDVVRRWKAEGRQGGRAELLLRLAETGRCASTVNCGTPCSRISASRSGHTLYVRSASTPSCSLRTSYRIMTPWLGTPTS